MSACVDNVLCRVQVGQGNIKMYYMVHVFHCWLINYYWVKSPVLNGIIFDSSLTPDSSVLGIVLS